MEDLKLVTTLPGDKRICCCLLHTEKGWVYSTTLWNTVEGKSIGEWEHFYQLEAVEHYVQTVKTLRKANDQAGS